MHEEMAGLAKSAAIGAGSFVALVVTGLDSKVLATVVAALLALLSWNARQILNQLARGASKMDSMNKRLVAVQHAVAAIIVSDDKAREAVERTSGERLHDLLSPGSGEHESRES